MALRPTTRLGKATCIKWHKMLALVVTFCWDLVSCPSALTHHTNANDAPCAMLPRHHFAARARSYGRAGACAPPRAQALTVTRSGVNALILERTEKLPHPEAAAGMQAGGRAGMGDCHSGAQKGMSI